MLYRVSMQRFGFFLDQAKVTTVMTLNYPTLKHAKSRLQINALQGDVWMACLMKYLLDLEIDLTSSVC